WMGAFLQPFGFKNKVALGADAALFEHEVEFELASAGLAARANEMNVVNRVASEAFRRARIVDAAFNCFGDVGGDDFLFVICSDSAAGIGIPPSEKLVGVFPECSLVKVPVIARPPVAHVVFPLASRTSAMMSSESSRACVSVQSSRRGSL